MPSPHSSPSPSRAGLIASPVTGTASSSTAIERQFDELNVWRRGDERAPHKPLLILMALGALSRGQCGLVYTECEDSLAELLREFGPPTRSGALHPEYPFWRLQNDGLWVVQTDRPMRTRQGNTDPPRTELRQANARGRFSPELEQRLRASPNLVGRIAQRVLDAHFPDTLHEDILAAVGLAAADADGQSEACTRRRRDPAFRQAVLTAYQFRCAVCGLDLRLGSLTIGLEAAHVKWHQARGPDAVHNGAAMCNLHHKLFDLGAFTIDPEARILVSEKVHGTTGLEEVLVRYHGALAARPLRVEHQLLPEFVVWHHRWVFKREARP